MVPPLLKARGVARAQGSGAVAVQPQCPGRVHHSPHLPSVRSSASLDSLALLASCAPRGVSASSYLAWVEGAPGGVSVQQLSPRLCCPAGLPVHFLLDVPS